MGATTGAEVTARGYPPARRSADRDATALEGWIERFAGAWSDPHGLESFGGLLESIHPRAAVVQPSVLHPATSGPDGLAAVVGRLLGSLPEIRGELIRSALAGDAAVVELEFQPWRSRRVLPWRTMHRAVLDADGLVVDYRMYGDPTSVLGGALVRPWGWPRAARLLRGRGAGPPPAGEALYEEPRYATLEEQLDAVDAQMATLAPDVDYPEQMGRFVREFVEHYADPEKLAEVADRVADVTHRHARFVQPYLMYPPGVGLDALRRQFRRWLRAVPGVRGRVVRWAARGDSVFIELEVIAFADRRPYYWRTLERMSFRDGLIVERRTVTDPLPLFGQFALRPHTWPNMVHAYLP